MKSMKSWCRDNDQPRHSEHIEIGCGDYFKMQLGFNTLNHDIIIILSWAIHSLPIDPSIAILLSSLLSTFRLLYELLANLFSDTQVDSAQRP